MFFMPIASSATPGIGNVRETEPAVTTTMSYSMSHGSPTAGVIVATLFAWSTLVTFAVITCVRLRWRRWETTAWRGSIEPDATSGRNGWYVMYGSGSTIVT